MNEATDDPLPKQAYLFNNTCRSSSKALRDVSEEGSTAGAWLVMVSCLSSRSFCAHPSSYFYFSLVLQVLRWTLQRLKWSLLEFDFQATACGSPDNKRVLERI
jgi:hypothetical protein